MERRIFLEKVGNCRDLGGILTEDGRRIRPGKLLRAANLAAATEADMQKLCGEYGLRAVVDLRTEREREQYPDVKTDAVTYHPVPVFDDAVFGVSHEKETEEKQTEALIPPLEDLYCMMVSEESCRRNLGRAVRTVMEHPADQGSILWHCTEGKDRCGLVTAILLTALSVSREQIMEDYLITNEVNKPKAEAIYQQLLASGKSGTAAVSVREAYLAKREYIEAAFSVIDTQYQDAEHYIREGLGIPDTCVQRFRERVLECQAAGSSET